MGKSAIMDFVKKLVNQEVQEAPLLIAMYII